MTTQQTEKINKLLEDYKNRCSVYVGYGDFSDSVFYVYQNTNNVNDKNITIYSSFISGLSDDSQPFYSVVSLLVEPSGDTIELSSLLNSNEIREYYKGLTQIN